MQGGTREVLSSTESYKFIGMTTLNFPALHPSHSSFPFRSWKTPKVPHLKAVPFISSRGRTKSVSNVPKLLLASHSLGPALLNVLFSFLPCFYYLREQIRLMLRWETHMSSKSGRRRWRKIHDRIKGYYFLIFWWESPIKRIFPSLCVFAFGCSGVLCRGKLITNKFYGATSARWWWVGIFIFGKMF